MSEIAPAQDSSELGDCLAELEALELEAETGTYRRTEGNGSLDDACASAEEKLKKLAKQLKAYEGQQGRVLNSQGHEIGMVTYQNGRFIVREGGDAKSKEMTLPMQSEHVIDSSVLGILVKFGLLPKLEGDNQNLQKLAAIKALGRLAHQLLLNKITAPENKKKSVDEYVARRRRTLWAALLGCSVGFVAIGHAAGPGPNIYTSTYRQMAEDPANEGKLDSLLNEMRTKLAAGEKNYELLLDTNHNTPEAELALVRVMTERKLSISPQLFGYFKHSASQIAAIVEPSWDSPLLDLTDPPAWYYEKSRTYAVADYLDALYKAVLEHHNYPPQLLPQYLSERSSKVTPDEIKAYIEKAAIIHRDTLQYLPSDELTVLALAKTDTVFQPSQTLAKSGEHEKIIRSLQPLYSASTSQSPPYIRHDVEPDSGSPVYEALFQYLAKIDTYNWEDWLRSDDVPDEEKARIVRFCQQINPRHYRVYSIIPVSAQVDFIENLRPDAWKNQDIAKALHEASNEPLRRKIEEKVKEQGGTLPKKQ